MSRPLKPFIVTWVGTTDLQAMNAWRKKNGLSPCSGIRENLSLSGEEKPGHNGPVRTLTDDHEAKRIYLLFSREFAPAADMMCEWVQRGNGAACEPILTDVENPASYDEVYAAMESFFRTHWNNEDATRFWFNLTPGTPATQAILLYLSQVRYAGGKAWQVVGPQHARNGSQCFEVRLPFRLPVEAWRQQAKPLSDDTRLQEVLRVYAPVRAVNILLLGESGVGKTYFARRIHEVSCGKDARFVEVNCAELAAGDGNMFRAALFGTRKGAYTGAVDTEGAFKRAAGGTLFLDEIGEIPLERQAILLRALQEKKIDVVGGGSEEVRDVRIVAATNRDLVEEVRAGRFRQDLFYRIAMYPVRLPPLREWARSDKPRFRQTVREMLEGLRHEAQELNKDWTLADEVWPVLEEHNWPGNMRELRHLLLLSCVSAHVRQTNVLTPEDVESHLARVRPLAEAFVTEGSDEREDFLPSNLDKWLDGKRALFVERALQRTGNNCRQAARLLGIREHKLGYILKRGGKK